ncbi:non-ribosomal peptide synthetase [Anaerocolumna xylanovorans]|uniref:Amino acid adenylation domain-containing protein n=1 Tax=Anaerocolumna xylanovorans DSM 12503 TaxID=1121345 RepID=A0A1M7YMI3_9FIRM|nr:non-ribosomal peptide synthetase [Anaerocolumna xylanovorans]SHO53824.1 amino acid adenylation domain-containing protein [Anaerocolumna xylanovorans DSM 12503]
MIKNKLTYAQRNIIELHESFPNTSICNICFEVERSHEISDIQEAINIYLAQNSMFRSRIIKEDNEYYQIIEEEHSYTQCNINTIEQSEFNEFLSRPFDIYNSELWRCALITREGKDYILACIHHIICDAMSSYLIYKDIVSILDSGFIEEKKDFYSFVKGEEKYLASKKYLGDKAFWESIYKVKPDIVKISQNKVRVLDALGKRKCFAMDQDVKEAIESVTSKCSCSIYDVFLAALGFYLGYINNYCTGVNIGTTALNRSKEYMKTAGLFINVIPINLDINYNYSISEYIDYINKIKKMYFWHQKYPYRKLLSHVNQEYNETKLFHVLLSYQPDKIIGIDKHINFQWFFNNFTESDLNIHILDRTDEIGIFYDYKISAFSEQEIDRLNNNLCKIICELNKSPDTLLKEIEVIGQYDKETILNKFNHKIEKNAFVSLQDIIERHCLEEKDKSAVVFKDIVISYEELWYRSGLIADSLSEVGIKNGDVVGIMTGRNEKYIISLLGILRSGAAYLSLDSAHPQNRRQFIIEDSNMKCIIAEDKAMVEVDIPQLNMDTLLKSDKGRVEIKIKQTRDSLAYILYTSGSTGKPKGVKIKHSSIINLINGLYQEVYCNLTESVNVGLTASVLFDASVQQIYAALLLGHTLHIIPDEIKKNGRSYLQYIREKKFNVLDMTPSHLRILIDGNIDNIREIGPEYLLVGGEALRSNLVKEFLQTYNVNSPVIFNVYGPTECCVDSTIYRIDDINQITNKVVPIGKPLPNTRIYILDKEKKLLPVGLPGEIYISGDGVAEGYVNMENENKKRFLEDSFYTGYKMYRTGDLGRFGENGIVEYIGRIDDQVKIRGFRVELGEIESNISNQKGVDTAVVAVNGEEENKQLVSFVVLEEGYQIDGLLENLKKELPYYMIPERFIAIDDIPITANGKVDKKKLLTLCEPVLTAAQISSQDEMEIKLLKIWQEVLKRDDVGVTDNFFDVGGHSLNMTSLLTMVEKEFHCEIPWGVFYQKADVRSIAGYIKSVTRSTYTSIGKSIQKEYYTLSSAQKRMYLTQQMDRMGITNNCPIIIEMRGKVDYRKLKEALQAVVNRHEALRTVFVMHQGEVVQKILDDVILPFDICTEFESIESLIQNFIHPFDLEKGPLIRAQLAYVLQDHCYFLIDIHHIVTDGESFKLIMQEITELYNGRELPEVKYQYRDFSEWQNNMDSEGKMKKQEAYWIDTFKNGIPKLEIPLDYKHPAFMTFEGKTINKELTKEQVEKLALIAKEQDLTLFTLLLSAYGILLYSITDNAEFVIGIPVAARTHFDLQNIVGYFVNMLPVKIDIQESNVSDLFSRIKQRTLEAYDNQDYLFEKLIEKMDNQAGTANSIFQTCFTYTMGLDIIDMEGIETRVIYPEYPVSKFNFLINVIHEKNKIIIAFSYSTQLFKQETANIIIDKYMDIIEKIIENHNVRLTELLNNETGITDEMFEF